jgi:hypothetical protein
VDDFALAENAPEKSMWSDVGRLAIEILAQSARQIAIGPSAVAVGLSGPEHAETRIAQPQSLFEHCVENGS